MNTDEALGCVFVVLMLFIGIMAIVGYIYRDDIELQRQHRIERQRNEQLSQYRKEAEAIKEKIDIYVKKGFTRQEAVELLKQELSQ